MKTVFEVRVERKLYDDEGNFVASETLFSTESPRPERLLAFAPGQVEGALIDETDYADDPAERVAAMVAALPKVPAVDTFANERPDGWEPPGEPVAGHVAPAPAAATTEDGKPKRTRRTKAQIAADKAAEAAKANGGTVPADAPPLGIPGDPVLVATDGGAMVYANGPALPAEGVQGGGGPSEVTSDGVSYGGDRVPPQPEPAAAPAEGGGTWNPFLSPAR